MRKKNGGKVIASGGFGCVFRPALRCKGKTIREKDKITKLMIKKYATSEYNDIKKYSHILKKIPSYKDFFLIDGFHLCNPAPLNSEDKQNFKKVCTALPKKNINSVNINTSLDQLFALNMPDGGIALDDFFYKSGSYFNIVDINNTLLNLLLKGIIPMNQNHIFHCDIKDSNILVDTKNDKINTRLIDWGLSTIYNPNKTTFIPKIWLNRPFQFNTPFSIILFSEKFAVKYKHFLDSRNNISFTLNNKQISNYAEDIKSILNYKTQITNKELKEFIVNYIHYWLKERGLGHFKFINSIIKKLFLNDIPSNIQDKNEQNKYIINHLTIPIITNYLYFILINFTERNVNGDVVFHTYLNSVYIKIVDIYGFISCYYPILEIYYENYNTLSTNEKNIFDIIKKIFIKYLYEPRLTEIDVGELINEFKKLNPLFFLEERIQAKPFSLLSKTISSKKIVSNKRTRKNKKIG